MAAGGGGVDVGYFAIPIIPSFEGIEGKINAGLAGKFTHAGKKAGEEVGAGIAGGIDANQAKVKAALDKYNALYNRHADALGKVRVEQAKLTAEKAKDQQNDVKVLALTERLEAARRKEVQSMKLATDQHKLYEAAVKRTTAAASTASGGHGFGHLEETGKSIFESLTKAAGALGPLGGALEGVSGSALGMGSSMLSAASGAGIMAGAVGGAAVGLTALVAGGAVVVEKLYEIGDAFNQMENNVSFKTGATGESLTKLTNTVKAVAGETSSSIATVGNITADASRSLHLTGEELTTVTKSLADLNERTGEATNIRDLGKAFRGFGVDAKDQNDALNQLYTASTNTGQSVNDLIHNVTVGGAPLRELGLDFGKSAALMSSFENAGLDGTKMVTGLRKAVGEFAKENKDIPKALRDSVTELHDFAEAAKKGDTAADDMGVTLANKLFGPKTGVQFWDAVKSGNLDLQSLSGSMDTATLSISGMADQTETAAQKWEKLKNKMEIAVQPIATKVFDIASSGLSDLTDWVDHNHGTIIHFFTDVGIAGIRAFQGIALVLGPTLEGLGSTINLLKTVSDWTGIGSVIDLGDAPQKMADMGAALGHIGGQGGDDAIKKLEDLGNAAANSVVLTDKLGGSVSSLKAEAEGVTLNVKDNTPETAARLRELGVHLEAMANNPTILRLVPDTPAAQKILDDFRAGQDNTPITPPVTPHITVEGKSNMDTFFDQYKNMVINPTAQPGAGPPPAGTSPGGWTSIMPGAHARGGIDVWGSVASFAAGGLPNRAMIQAPVGPGGLVNWAEPSTGGEAYIPLGPSNRDRSQRIWAEVGKRIGALKMQTGGITAYDNAILEAQTIGDGRAYNYGGTGPNFDCSGAQSDIYAVMTGKPTGKRYFDTESDFLALGFQKGYQAGAYNIGVHNGGGGMSSHMAATLPNGVNFESGGKTNTTNYGKGAAGANDPQFEHKYFLAVAGNPTGTNTAGQAAGGGGGSYNAAGYYTGGGGGGGGGAVGAGGQAGHYEPDPKAVGTAQQGVRDAESKVAIAQQKLDELKGNAKESERMTLQRELDKAKADKVKADEALTSAQQGKFVADPKTAGTTGGAGANPFGGAGNPGSILMGGMLQTLGLDGSWLPDIKNLGIFKLLDAIMKITYTPVGDGKFTGGLLAGLGGTTGSTAASGATTGGTTGGGGDPIAGLLGLPFGMLPNVMAPGPPPLGTAASGQGTGPPPGPVDQSTNITVNNPQGDPHTITTGVRRALLNTPRLDTYAPAGGS